MRYIYDFKTLKVMLTIVAKNNKGIKFSIGLYPYANVLSIGSKVLINGKEIGNVIMGDFEKKLTKKRLDFIRSYIKANKISMIIFFRSSKNKYHFICPDVFDNFLDCLHHAHNLGAENNYLTLSAARSEFILRISKKSKKGEPVFKTMLLGERKNKLSKPHIIHMSNLYGLPLKMFKGYTMIGQDTETEMYKTTNI